MKVKNILFSNLSTSTAKKALNLYNAVRIYSSYSRNNYSPIKHLEEECRLQTAFRHPFFEYLKDQKEEGFNAEQFAIYRANFFFRTEITATSIAKFMVVAVKENDFETASQTGDNFRDQTGSSDPNKSQLMLDSHNAHGEKIFGLDKETFKSVAKSSLLVPEVFEYRQSKLASFQKPYPYIVGNFIAHELAADSMLNHFKQAFFDSYKGYYSKEEYEQLTEYYTVHDNPTQEVGVEEKHGQMALETAKRIYEANAKHMPKIRQGAMDFLSAQSHLWFGILREMEQNKAKSAPVIPKLKFTQPAPEPTPSNTKAWPAATNSVSKEI